jgi:hypothetical protein
MAACEIASCSSATVSGGMRTVFIPTMLGSAAFGNRGFSSCGNLTTHQILKGAASILLGIIRPPAPTDKGKKHPIEAHANNLSSALFIPFRSPD